MTQDTQARDRVRERQRFDAVNAALFPRHARHMLRLARAGHDDFRLLHWRFSYAHTTKTARLTFIRRTGRIALHQPRREEKAWVHVAAVVLRTGEVFLARARPGIHDRYARRVGYDIAAGRALRAAADWATRGTTEVLFDPEAPVLPGPALLVPPDAPAATLEEQLHEPVAALAATSGPAGRRKLKG